MHGLRVRMERGLDVLRQFRRPADLWLFLRICVFALAVPLLLHFKLARLQEWLRPRGSAPSPDPVEVEHIVNWVDAVLQAGRPLVRARCTTRGLTLYTFLNRAGVDVELCFGAGYATGEFAAHCWLIKDGEPFLEAQDPRLLYASVFTFPGRGEQATLPS